MSDKIRVLIVDDLPETRENVRKLLQFEPDVEVVDQAGDGNQAIEKAKQHEPDVVLMDINMPGLDGISASQAITKAVPKSQIIIMSVQSEADYLRKAMLAGARDFLMKPFSGDELMAAIRRVFETRPAITAAATMAAAGAGAGLAVSQGPQGKILSVYSPKGGSGCTTLAVNIGVALASRGYKTALVDANLQFGDVAVTLNMKPTTTIVDLMERINELEADLISSVMIKHRSGLDVLLPPARPDMESSVTDESMDILLRRLREIYEFIIVDTASNLDDVTISVLNTSDRVLLATQQSLASLTNARRFFDLLDNPNSSEKKIMLVVNRASEKLGISVSDVAKALKYPVISAIPLDEIGFTSSSDRGQPIITSSRGRRDAVLLSLTKLADSIEQELGQDLPEGASVTNGSSPKKKTLFGRLFGG